MYSIFFLTIQLESAATDIQYYNVITDADLTLARERPSSDSPKPQSTIHRSNHQQFEIQTSWCERAERVGNHLAQHDITGSGGLAGQAGP